MVGWPATVARVCGSVSIITDRVVSHAPWAPPVHAPVRELLGEIADCKYIHTYIPAPLGSPQHLLILAALAVQAVPVAWSGPVPPSRPHVRRHRPTSPQVSTRGSRWGSSSPAAITKLLQHHSMHLLTRDCEQRWRRQGQRIHSSSSSSSSCHHLPLWLPSWHHEHWMWHTHTQAREACPAAVTAVKVAAAVFELLPPPTQAPTGHC